MREFFLSIALFIGATMPADAQQAVIEVGSLAPDIVYTNDNGVEVKLSDLRGKMVLVDFWASWCKPCRKESPVLVAAYNKYRDARFDNGNGFEIFSVSLDAKKDAWEAAIASDSLNWPHHVSDLMGWRSNYAKLYGVKSIPASFLVDADGVVVAVNLRGDRLGSMLKKKRKISLFRGEED